MAQDYSEYLAIHVLNEQQAVSYRSLSRALKVHVNLAKQMLYEFHRKQNAKKPDTVHATYLISGTRASRTSSQASGAHSQDDGDTVMQSSPPIPGSPPPGAPEDDEVPVPVRSILLARQEHLDKAKATFEEITSIHVYSLQAGGLSDIQTLSECNRNITATYANEDPLEAWRQYGTIQDPNVKRRTQRTQPPAPASTIKAAPAKPKSAPAPAKPAAIEKQASKASDASQSSAKATPEPQTSTAAAKKSATAKVPTNKRQNSDIFKSFAKGANKPKKTPDSSAAPSPAPPPADDEPIGGMSDDEPGDAENDEAVEAKEVAGKLRKERQAELEAMMDASDDEPMEDPVESAPESQEIEVSQPTEPEEPKETMTVENGRRRGRRRVMKKKTVKDDEGYLVTREEAAWESFSEDEPAPKKAKMAPAAAAAATAKGTAKISKGAKPGQGNIMAFFGKK